MSLPTFSLLFCLIILEQTLSFHHGHYGYVTKHGSLHLRHIECETCNIDTSIATRSGSRAKDSVMMKMQTYSRLAASMAPRRKQHFVFDSKSNHGVYQGNIRNSKSIVASFMTPKDESNSDDLFDPLLSPHAYPNGTDGGKQKAKQNEGKDDGDNWSPFKMNSVKDDFRGSSDEQYGVEKSIFTSKWSQPTVNSLGAAEKFIPLNTASDSIEKSEATNDSDAKDDALFDPLISPHCYPKGTSAGPVSKSSSSQSFYRTRIGVLLIDHGSRREASNIHLEELAAMYQQRAPSHYVIQAAHMEIAKPSIRDGIKTLIEEERVDKIVCHPFFLSPGRHVVEDIPQLIEEAIQELRIGRNEGEYSHVEVFTTKHVGSRMDMMIDMIDAMVDETIGNEILIQQSGFVEKDPSSTLGGFFGEIQRMLDEQL